jgi:hypothetical protein
MALGFFRTFSFICGFGAGNESFACQAQFLWRSHEIPPVLAAPASYEHKVSNEYAGENIKGG